MFNMSDLSIALQSTEKAYTFPFKDIFLDSIAPNPLDMLPKQIWVRNSTFSSSALNLKIYFPLTNR